MNKKPTILILSESKSISTRLGEIEWHGVDFRYVEAIVACGGCPVIMPPVDYNIVDDFVENISGVLLIGGGDVDPVLYGRDQNSEVWGVCRQRDEVELEVAAYAIKNHVPLLAICRGMHIVNVLRGGDLYQHLLPEYGHTEYRRSSALVHYNSVDVNSNLYRIFDSKRVIGVNSLHHQAISGLGFGLRAVSHSLRDGVIEAIELKDSKLFLGVQWHPEILLNQREQKDIFQWLVDEACKRASGTTVNSV